MSGRVYLLIRARPFSSRWEMKGRRGFPNGPGQRLTFPGGFRVDPVGRSANQLLHRWMRSQEKQVTDGVSCPRL